MFPVSVAEVVGSHPECTCCSFQIIKTASTSLFHKWLTGKKRHAISVMDVNINGFDVSKCPRFEAA